MHHQSNARIVGVASSELYPPPLPLLPSLNGSSDIRNAIVSSATTSNNNNNATVSRGIINHNNPNSKPNQEEYETRRNGQQQLQSHVLINKKRGIIDFQSVNSLSESQTLQAPHTKCDRDDNDGQVRYNRCSSPRLKSLKDGSSLTVGLSFLNAKRSGTLDSQKLDSFLDWYEQKFDLEPFDINEVHGLSGKFDIASLLIPPQPPSRNVDEKKEWHTKCVQTFPEKVVSQTQMIQSQPLVCLSDLSRLLAAILSDDDIQDKNAKNNNGKDSVPTPCKCESLSQIKEESNSEDKRNAAKVFSSPSVPLQSTEDGFQETPTKQNGIKDSTTCTKPEPDTVTIIDRNSVNASNAEVDSSIDISDVTAMKKISDDVSNTPPQQPQHIDNSKKRNIIGEDEKEDTVKTKIEENLAAESKSATKLLVTTLYSQPPISLTPSNKTQHDHPLAPRKSRIPLPLQKIKVESSTTQEVTPTTSNASYSLKRCDRDRDFRKNSQDVKQKQVCRPPTAAAVKVHVGNKVSKESNNNLFQSTMNSSRKSIPVPIKRTEKPSLPTTFSRNPDSKIRPLKALPSPTGKNIGQGDEIANCLSLIDGLSGHTSWVMNKLLECPLPSENAANRVKRLKECIDIGDFFGVPYVSKQILDHTAFK